MISSGSVVDGRTFAELPFGEGLSGLGDEVGVRLDVGVGASVVEEDVAVSLIILDEDEFLKGRNLSLIDFF